MSATTFSEANEQSYNDFLYGVREFFNQLQNKFFPLLNELYINETPFISNIEH